MTTQDTKPTTRLTNSEWRGTQIVVSLHPRFVELRLKSGRDTYTIPYEDLLEIVMMRQAKQIAGDIPKGRRRR